MGSENHSGFLGTYFSKESVLRLSKTSRILAWVILGIYALQLLISFGGNILLIVRGFWAGMGLMDIIQNFLFAAQPFLVGVVYSFALLGISELLLVFLDIEDNTRRAARGK